MVTVFPASIIPLPIHRDVWRRVERLEIPFSSHGVDPYGIDQHELGRFFTLLRFLYTTYFKISVFGIESVPVRGRAMLVGNHSGGWAMDALMVIASTFFELNPPRLAQGMAEKFLKQVPFLSSFTNRIGQLTGLPEHSVRLLNDDRLLLVFPEGTRGTAKLFPERDSLVSFGTGFARIALQTSSPIIPFAFIGGGEAIPTVRNLYGLGKRLGIPYVPITPYGLPFPLPVTLQILYGAPIQLEGSSRDTDDAVAVHVERVKTAIADLVRQGRDLREGRIQAKDLKLT